MITLAAETNFIFTSAYTPGNALPTITDALTIVATSSALVRDADAPEMRFFNATAPLEIIGLIMDNGLLTDEPGGAIFTTSGLRLDSVSMDNNRSINRSGGAVYFDAPSGILSIAGSSFNGNVASMGGALSIVNAFSAFIERSYFGTNNATSRGGAIDFTIPLTISDTMFESNTAQAEGGALWDCSVSGGTTFISSSTLISNATAANNGSAYAGCTGGTNVSIVNSTISYNTSIALHVRSGSMDISFSTLYGNWRTLHNSGGVTRLYALIIDSLTTPLCVGSIIDTGQVFATDTSCGNAVAVTPAALQLNIVPNFNGGSTLNHAVGTGSIALSTASCYPLSGSLLDVDQRGAFRPNPAESFCDAGSYEEQTSYGPTPTPTPTPTFTPTATPPVCGSVIPNPVTTAFELGCAITLANNDSLYPGPDIITIASGADIVFSGPYTGVGNTANPQITSPIIINGNGATLRRNTSVPDLRAFLIGGGSLTLRDMTLRDWRASGDGGAIFSLGALTLENVLLNNNSSLLNGGAIFNNTPVSLQMTDTTLTNNTAAADGGGVSMRGGSGVFTNVLISSNQATTGGGIGMSLSASLQIRNSRVENNIASDGSAAGRGGGLHSTSTGAIFIEDSSFVGNFAQQDAGGLYSESSNLNIQRSTFDDNSAGANYGNLVQCTVSTGNFTLRNSTISNGTDSGGVGGMSICSTVSGTTDNVTVSGNSGIGIEARGSMIFSSTTIAFNGRGIFSTALNSLKDSVLVSNGTINCAGSLIYQGRNYSTDTTCPASPNVINASAAAIALGALTNNGGSTDTHYPADTSVIRNTILPANCTDSAGSPLTEDQRGTTRPAGTGCEPGAVENDTAGGGGGAEEPDAFLIEELRDGEATYAPTLEPGATATAVMPELIPVIEDDEPPAPDDTPTPEPTVTLTETPTPEPTVTLTPSASPTLPEAATPFASPMPPLLNGSAPGLTPTPTSTLAPAARALDFTAWVVRR
jgi:hypothetical protein